MKKVKKAITLLRKKFGDGVLSVGEFRGQSTIVLNRDVIVQACQILRDDIDLNFNVLAALTAVDYWPEEPRFAIIYRLFSITNNVFIGLKVPLQGTSTEIATIESVYPNANWREREVYDLFGITFTDHSDLRRILMPFDWKGHPLRKDYPLGEEEIQFSFNFDEIDRRKPYARE
jgi:NADH-quinone oxidoreductase subunit C